MRKQHFKALVFAVSVVGWSQSAVADPSDMLKNGDIWRHCEHYFLTGERYQADNDHYAIKDVSLEFIKTIKRFKPRTKDEAFLYVECVNLGNGNATQAQDAILREEAEDDEFFSLAVTDATNNSNASQFEYTKDLDGKHRLLPDAELASQNFENILEEESTKSLGVAAQVLGQVGIALAQATTLYVGNDFGVYSYNSYRGSPQNWTQFTNNASQTYGQTSASGSAGSSGSGHGATLAPLTPTSPSGGSSTGGSWGPPPPGDSEPSHGSGEASSSTEQVAAKPAEAPAGALLERARHLDDSCIGYRMANDAAMAVVENRCDTPVVFFWCWIPKGGSSCAPSLISNVIAPGSSDRVQGPNENEQQLAEYVVCDMSNRQHICMK